MLLSRALFHLSRRSSYSPALRPRLHPLAISRRSSYSPSTLPVATTSTSHPDSRDTNDEQPTESLSAVVERLREGESVVSAFQRWMGQGFPIHRGDVFHAINRMRRLRMYKRALEVMEWVIRESPYKPRELEYSYLLEFTIKLHGIPYGEKLFSRIPAGFQGELLYNNLVMACLDKGAIRLSIAYMKKMRELSYPISPYVYNRLILLHSSPGLKKSIPKILTQMKADRAMPHTSTYNILLKMEADDHDIDGLAKVFNDMKRLQVEPNEITYGILATAHAIAGLYTVSETYAVFLEKSKTGTNWSTLDVLLILYGYLGKEEELERTWNQVQNLPHVRSKSFCLAIEAFGRIGRINRSEELWNELKLVKELKFTKHFNSIISVYCRFGLLDKASELFKEMEMKECDPNAITYRHLALGCLKAGLAQDALKTLEMGKAQTVSFQVRRSIPWLETTYSIMEAFADSGDLENAKKFFDELEETRYCKYAFVYNTLLKAYVNAKAYDPNLLKRMILSGARPDAQTYSLIQLIEQQKT